MDNHLIVWKGNGYAVSQWKIKKRNKFMDVLQHEGRKTILEIGAGTGKDAKALSDHGYELTCIDLSPEMIRYCKELGLQACVMDCYDLEFSDHAFDAVYAFNCLLHVPNEEMDKVLMGISRVLKNDGVFYLGLYGGKDSEEIWESDLCDPKRFFAFRSDDAIQALVKKYFEIIYFQTVPLDEGELHFQSLILRKPSK